MTFHIPVDMEVEYFGPLDRISDESAEITGGGGPFMFARTTLTNADLVFTGRFNISTQATIDASTIDGLSISFPGQGLVSEMEGFRGVTALQFTNPDYENRLFRDIQLTGLQLTGSNGVDVLLGTPVRDVVAGRAGSDRIFSGRGNDSISGNDGADFVFAGPGHDEVTGDNGADRIRGEDGNDDLHGNSGNDLLVGGAGHDALRGGKAMIAFLPALVRIWFWPGPAKIG